MINSTQNQNVNSFLGLISFIFLLSFGYEGKITAQIRPDFKTVAKFVLFSGNGAVSSTGISILKGNVGADIGAISGFGSPTTLNGTIENVNAVTTQAALDLRAVCAQLQNTPATITNHNTIYGNGETLVPGVYSAGAAASINGSLTLDAQGNPNALFIFKIGGALTGASNTTIVLTNGALAANVIWIANGAISMAAGTTMNGVLIGYNGAVSMGAGCILNGSLYSNVGAVSVYETRATIATVSSSYNFLGTYTSNGTPLYFVTSDVVTAETLSLVQNSLPENYPVPTYNPQYISSGYETDIIIDSLADVWVTFVSEGAGYKNVLGFYAYDMNNPPTTAPTASQITIVFPNVSAAGSGGSLLAGNKVKIGTFQPGTGIGWVLLANAWNGSIVTDGLWRLFSNPNFNPEANPSLRQHNVLLNDPDNERVILGFEDIRRDNGSCDNDFNDAVFYVSSNPYTAMRSSNLADVSSATDVSSANNGGLESKGDLATLIAKRNFSRIKTNSFADTKAKQAVFSSATPMFSRSNATVNFSSLIPTTGMFGTETTYVSTPADLLGITNALEVYSVDYYQNSTRVAAVLATATTNGIYGHSKAICDRLNNSTLEDVRTIQLNGYEIIMVKIKRANGAIEFALNFSVQQLDSENKLHSYWNINQYPSGDYLNFQVWGSSMGQVSSITNYILNQFQTQISLTEDAVNNRIPSVFVKKGSYNNGNLYLKLINKSNASSITFSGNKKATELAVLETISQNINLTNAYEQDIVVNTGGIFDIGFSINGNNSPQLDALYMADGPWGLDYNATETTITNYTIQNSTNTVNSDEFSIERNTTVAGEVYGTINIFRNILPGELTFDASNYSAVRFSIQNSLPVEVILVTENTTDWNNRLRFQIPANATNTEVALAFSDFTNALGETFTNEKIKGFVFSTIGNYTSFQPFAIAISNLKLANSALNNQNFDAVQATKMYNYPNPCKNSTTIVLPRNAVVKNIKVIDMLGNVVINQNQNSNQLINEIMLNLEGINKGLYLFEVTTNTNEKLISKFLKN